MTEISGEWLHYAERDLKSADFLLNMRPIPIEIICFHCRESVEKALKGVLTEHDIEPPKTHDLRELCQMCAEFSPDFMELTAPCKTLTRCGIAPGYPNASELSEELMNKALMDSHTILDFVLSVLEEGTES